MDMKLLSLGRQLLVADLMRLLHECSIAFDKKSQPNFIKRFILALW
jgi:hypothetical protein